MARVKGALGMKTLVKFYEMHLNGEKVDMKVMKQIKKKGIDKQKVSSVSVPKVKKVVKKVSKVTKKVSVVCGTVRTMWKESGKGYRLQINDCTKTDAVRFAKSSLSSIAAFQHGSGRRARFIFKKTFSDMADARRWGKRNGFEFIK